MKASTKAAWKPLLAALLMGGLGAMVGSTLARSGLQYPHVKASLQSLAAWDLLAVPVLLVAVLAFHEAGHLVGGISRGMRFLLFIAGPFGFFRGADGIRFRWCFKLGTLGGLAAALPAPGQPLEPQLRRLIAAGPGASLLLAGLGAAAFFGGEGRAAAYGLFTGLFSAAIFLVTALPFRAGGFMSDGMQLLQLRRDPGMVERKTRLMALVGISMGGARPRELDPALLTSAQALTGVETSYDVGVWMYSFAQALDSGDVAAASDWLDRMEGCFADYPDGFRQGLAIELALFEALHRRRLAEAEAWLGKARGGLVDDSRRALAEAAVAALAGRRDEALAGLDRAQARLGRGMDPGFSRLSAFQIQELRGQIRT